MSRITDISGMRFGRLTVLELSEQRFHGSACWKCRCDCGNVLVANGHSLRVGYVKSCGCLQMENRMKMGIANRKHFGCTYCGSDKHYARGYCRNCYEKARRGTLE